jgi:hypothetical protein
MIKFSELNKGNYVLAESDSQAWQGEITDFNNDEKEISVNNGIQDFWFKAKDLYPIPVDEARLLKMNFRKVVNEDGSVKYMKDAFRLLTPKQDEFSHYEIWYRDEKRQILEPIYLHQLQNHYMEMTKVHLTDSLD